MQQASLQIPVPVRYTIGVCWESFSRLIDAMQACTSRLVPMDVFGQKMPNVRRSLTESLFFRIDFLGEGQIAPPYASINCKIGIGGYFSDPHDCSVFHYCNGKVGERRTFSDWRKLVFGNI